MTPSPAKGFILSDQASLFGPEDVVGFGDASFAVREIDRDAANDIIRANHYSGVVYNASFIHLGIFAPSLLGVLQFGPAMNPASQASVVADTEQDAYLELNRMWLDDVLPRNSETRALSYAFKFIARKYPRIEWCQSFADERCWRFGVVYQAANFTYCGEHTSTFWELDGAMYHNSMMTRDPNQTKRAALLQENKERAIPHKLRQFRYIYFLQRRARKRLLLDVHDFPKHAAQKSMVIDADSSASGGFDSRAPLHTSNKTGAGHDA